MSSALKDKIDFAKANLAQINLDETDFINLPHYGNTYLRKSRNFALCMFVSLGMLLALLILWKANATPILIPMQMPERQQVQIVMQEYRIVEQLPETEKILADESDYKIQEPKPEEPKPKPKPEPKPEEPKPQEVKQETRPKPSPKPEPKPKVKEETPPSPVKQSIDTPSTAQSTSVEVASQNIQAEQQALGVLIAWLEKNKKYPKQAQRRGLEGIVTLNIKVNSQGVVESASIIGGNAPSILKKSARELARKAIGLNIGVKTALNVNVPVEYKIN